MRYAGLLAVLVAAIAVGLVFYQEPLVARYMDEVAVWLFRQFENRDFPLVLAAGIVAVAVILGAGYFFLIVLPQKLALRGLRAFIVRYSDETVFAEEFHEASQRLSKSRLIGHAWREFQETLVEPDHETTVVQNTTRPHTFINFSCAQDKSTALRIMPHIPNYFVGIGLLLTFVGLVAALNFANTSMEGNADEAVEGLRFVLAAATFKFWTSIAGLLSSIVLSFVFRLYALNLEGEFGALCRALEQRMAFATPQRIFVDVRNTIEEQLAETKKINTEIAMSIAEGVGEQFREHVPGMLADAVRPLVDAVQASSEKVREGATGGLENLVNQFATTLEGSTSQHLNHMSETLQQLTRSLEAMQGAMASSGEEFSSRMAEGSERLDMTMIEIADSMRSLVEGLKAQASDAGQAFGSSLRENIEQLSRQSEEMAERLAQQSRSASSAFSDEITRAAQALSTSANENAQSSAKFAEQLRESLGESVEGVQGAMDRIGASLSSLQGQLERQGSAMAAVSERSRDVAASMANASNSINRGLEPIERIGQSLDETTIRLERSVSSMAEKIDGAVNTVETVSSELSEVSKTLRSAWESYRVRFERVDEDLEQAFTKLQEAVESQQRNVQEFVRSLDDSFDKALSGLSGGIDGINTTIEDLTEALEKMNGAGRPT